MRTVIQRVTHASVAVPAQGYESSIDKGLLVLAAFIDEDTDEDIAWTARKIAARNFSYSGIATSGFAAFIYEGLFPFTVDAYNVN